MRTLQLQNNLFQIIKSKLNTESNLAKAIAESLNVSLDAAYKKIKGERLIDLAELQVLLSTYKIPIAELDNINNYGKVWFNFNPIGNNDFTYKNYLQQMVNNLKMLVSNNVKYIIYSAKEIPMFYNFMFPELGCFKSFVWQKSILNLTAFEEEKFSIYELDLEIIELGNQIYKLYNQIRSKEIWNYETVNCTYRQIDFYKIAGLFANNESYELIIEQYNKLLNHIENQTAIGRKIDYHTKENQAYFDLYHNELIVGDNSVLVQFEKNQLAFITPNAVNSFSSTQTEVTEYISNNFDTILSQSVRLNKQSDKIRKPFFDRIKNSYEL
ncbi:MAG: hypothetical protein ACOYMA_04555 [Bacteroidia bacterium]